MNTKFLFVFLIALICLSQVTKANNLRNLQTDEDPAAGNVYQCDAVKYQCPCDAATEDCHCWRCYDYTDQIVCEYLCL